mmetsp:Transcript_11188/g.23594  ORF Transcript_11188/g.23594 Transcript_11188/m.23594 type:complete len:249 (+) Transcript_11188:341-1087(+)
MGMTLGKGMPLTMSKKQKINGKSSTESELIAVDDALPQILWTRYFLECQGYEVKHNIIYQDNKSAILLEMNGKGSSSRRTKHIKVRYFFVKDKVDNKEVEIAHCLTEEMWADLMTKPRQGKGYKQFRAVVMNCPVEYSDQDELLHEAKYDAQAKREGHIKTSTKHDTKMTTEQAKGKSVDTVHRRGHPPQECVGETPAQNRPMPMASREATQPPRTLSQSTPRWCRQTFGSPRDDGWRRRAARAASFL